MLEVSCYLLWGPALESVTASVSSTGDISILGNEQVVIRAVVDPLSDDTVDVAKKLALLNRTGEPVSTDKDPKGRFVLVIEEPHNDSFTNADLRLEFSGIPDDIELELDAWVATKKDFDDEDIDVAAIPANEIPLTRTIVRNSSGAVTVSTTGTGIDVGNDGNFDDGEGDTDYSSHDAIDFTRRDRCPGHRQGG